MDDGIYQMKPLIVKAEKYKAGMADGTVTKKIRVTDGYQDCCVDYVDEKFPCIDTKYGKKSIYSGSEIILTFQNGDRTVMNNLAFQNLFDKVDEDVENLFCPINVSIEDMWKYCEKVDEEPMQKAPHLMENVYRFKCPSCKNSINSNTFVSIEEFEKFNVEHMIGCAKNRKVGIIADIGLFNKS